MALLNAFSQLDIFKKSIVLDEEAFATAADEFDELAGKIDSLYNDIEEMLSILENGFDTPAGHKFINACEKTLLEPLEKQRKVVEHVSENLRDARTMYQSVFDDYRDLVNYFNSD